MKRRSAKPVVGVISDVQQIGPHEYHTVSDKYVQALSRAGELTVLLLPSLDPELSIADYLPLLDGFFLTGAYSMVNPALYDAAKIAAPYDYDGRRDQQAMALIRAVIAADLPLLGICRGIQDINVALGGSLHQAVHELPGMLDHREDTHAELAVQYGTAHPVRLEPAGRLAEIYAQPEFLVNSLHSQGIDRLAEGLKAEAYAPDGLIEAVSVEAMSFGMAVQWHPEWDLMNNPQQLPLFKAFAEACRQQSEKRPYGTA